MSIIAELVSGIIHLLHGVNCKHSLIPLWDFNALLSDVFYDSFILINSITHSIVDCWLLFLFAGCVVVCLWTFLVLSMRLPDENLYDD